MKMVYSLHVGCMCFKPWFLILFFLYKMENPELFGTSTNSSTDHAVVCVYMCAYVFRCIYIYDIVIKLKHVKLKTEFRSTNDVCYQTTARATTTSWRAPRRTAARAWIRPPSVTASWTVPAASTRSIAVRPAYYRTVMVSECLMKIIFIC